jgi:predicted adenine nucleotide alpha hydrolase (AANH) superfamily ATPase
VRQSGQEGKKILLHLCCAPDAAVPWPALAGEGFDVCGFFYGDNIHPEEEWLRRAEAVEKLAGIMGARFERGDYNPSRWLAEASAFKDEPEGGKRCALCFGLQLEAAADAAILGGFSCLCTTLTISPHKDPALINRIGSEVCAGVGIEWIPRVWRKGDGFKLSVGKSLEWGLYRQNYCGCAYSFRGSQEKDH